MARDAEINNPPARPKNCFKHNAPLTYFEKRKSKLYLFRLQICSLYLDHLRFPQKLFLHTLKSIYKLLFFKLVFNRSKMAHILKLATSKKVPHIAPEKISKEPKQIPRAILPIKKTNQIYVKTKKKHDNS